MNSSHLSKSEMIDAMQNRDASYDGVFFVGVKTMRIYCLPSCRAKLPRVDNVEFLESVAEAADRNYRPCQRCKPHLFPDVRPRWMDSCLAYLHENCGEQITDPQLARVLGIDVSTLRRGCKAYLRKSPSAYLREYRLQRAATLLRARVAVLRVSEECGYQSLSGFTDAFIRQYGVSPASYANEKPVLPARR